MSNIDSSIQSAGTLSAGSIMKQSQDDLNGILHKNDDISGAATQPAHQTAAEIRNTAQADLDSIKSSTDSDSGSSDSVTFSPQAVNAVAQMATDGQNEDGSGNPSDSDIEADAKAYLNQYNNANEAKSNDDADDSAEAGLKKVFGDSLSSNQLNSYRQQMSDYFGVDLFARGRNNGGVTSSETQTSPNFANFTDDDGNLNNINGYMDTLQRVKTDDPSARITSASSLQDYARDHYDDDLNYVKTGNAENSFGEQRHDQAKNTDSKSEDYSFKDYLTQVSRDVYKERYGRTDTDESQGIKETKADDNRGTSQESFLNTITQNMASDTSSYDYEYYNEIESASQDLNDDITASETTYAVSGVGGA